MATTSTFLPVLFLAAAAASATPARAQRVLWRSEGLASQDQFGTFLGVVGDVDADGFADVIASSRFEQSTPNFDSPYVRVYSGRTGVLLHEFQGGADEDEFGNTATGAGDVDGDGHGDILIASSTVFSSTSNPLARVYLYSGATGAFIRQITAPAGASDFGISAVGAGDIDGDGLDDVVISARCESNCFGSLRAYSGATGSVLWHILAPERELLGSRIAAIGDVNADGITDIAASSIVQSFNGIGGRVRILSGADGTILNSIVRNTSSFETFGFQVSGLGDVNGDGEIEILISAPDSLGPGLVFVMTAIDGTLVHSLTGGSFDELGNSLSGGDDVDGDGVPDFAVGASGFAAVYSGATATELYRVSGETGDHFFGTAVALVGDTNGDGFGEFVAGGPRDNSIGLGSGTVYVHTLDAPNGGTSCIGNPNSTGARGRLATTSPSGYQAAANDLTLTASDLPPGFLGFFAVSRDLSVVPFAGGGAGKLCISGPAMGRYLGATAMIGGSGSVTLSPPTNRIPIGTAAGFSLVPALPGETFHFQFWHRDLTPAGTPTFNFTDAVSVTFG